MKGPSVTTTGSRPVATPEVLTGVNSEKSFLTTCATGSPGSRGVTIDIPPSPVGRGTSSGLETDDQTTLHLTHGLPPNTTPPPP